ncbi:MAG: alginate O-acetyltransferase AlgF [Spirochaetota bacterium]
MRRSTTKWRTPSLVAALMLAIASAAAGQEGNLYGSGAPEDAGFVRIVNAASGAPPPETTVGNVGFGPLEFAAASPYRPVGPGIYTVRLGGGTAELIVSTGAYYTIALHRDGVVVFEDPEHTDPTEAQLFFYNLASGAPVRLATSDGTEVVESVDSLESAVVTVNPVPVELAVFGDDGRLADVGDPGLERGESFSVFAVSADDEVRPFVVRAEVAAE